MNEANTSVPYRRLGSMLRHLREEHRESVAEVSGAVEIGIDDLSKFESGQSRPTQDILLLLISHFGIEEDSAAELWRLAGYEGRLDDEGDHSRGETEAKQRTQAMMIMLDPRVMYSDSVEVAANQQGVILNFSQTTGAESSPLTISRIGMSYDQAKAVMGILNQALFDKDNPRNSRRLGSGPEASGK